jgi:hypothetical protein
VQVFVRDRADEKTKCVSLGPKNVQGNGESSSPSISANGSLVTFESDANNLAKKDTNNLQDVFGSGISTSQPKGDGSSFFLFFDLLQTGDQTGGIVVVFD